MPDKIDRKEREGTRLTHVAEPPSNASQSQTARSMGPLGGYARRGRRDRERAWHPGPDPGNDPSLVLSGPSTPSGRSGACPPRCRQKACSGWGSSRPRTIAGWLPTSSIASGRFSLCRPSGQAKLLGEADAESARPKRHARRRQADRRGGTLLGAAPSGPSTFTLRWSDGTVSLVKVVAKTEAVQASMLELPKFSVETVATIPPDKLGVPEQAVLRSHGRRLVALCGAVPRQADRRHAAKRGSFRRQDRKRGLFSTEDIPGPRDGDRAGSQRHDAVCRNRQRVDPVVAAERRPGGRSRRRAAIAGEARHYLAGTDARRRDARGRRRRRRSDQLVLRETGLRTAEEARRRRSGAWSRKSRS